jgi:putative transcriptional regulator
MTKFGERLIESAEQALAWVRGEDVPGTVVHEPRPAIDVRAVRRRTGLTQAEFARRFGFPLGTPCATGSRASAPRRGRRGRGSWSSTPSPRRCCARSVWPPEGSRSQKLTRVNQTWYGKPTGTVNQAPIKPWRQPATWSHAREQPRLGRPELGEKGGLTSARQAWYGWAWPTVEEIGSFAAA